jgi:site-specific DNA-methyltransferase (adenine-specific)
MIQTIEISKVKSNPNNPRLIKDDKFLKLVKSIKEFPQMLDIRPIVVNDDMVVLGGNMRLKACKEAGLKQIPIIKASQLTEDQQREFIIKDNVGFGEWDWQLIANEWDVDQVTEWGLDVPDYKVEPEASEDDYEIPDEVKTDIVIGDLFEIGEHRLLCGDSTDSDQVAKLMNGEKADMVFTDPPYGMSYGGGRAKGDHVKNKKTGGVLIKAHGEIIGDNLRGDSLIQMVKDSILNGKLFSKENGAFYVCFTWRTYSDFEKAIIDAGLDIKACIVWNKKSIGLGYSDYRPQHEFIFYCKGDWFGDKNESDVWELSRGATGDYVHPTQKPVELVSRALKNSSNEKDVILELFTGSGSTMVAAHQLKRKCYGMELDPKYCQVIIDRMLKLDPSLQVKRNGKPYKCPVEEEK